jgi:hypothetical protein
VILESIARSIRTIDFNPFTTRKAFVIQNTVFEKSAGARRKKFENKEK